MAMRSAELGAAALLGPALADLVDGLPPAQAEDIAKSRRTPPQLSATKSTTESGGSQVFRTRPDMRPPVITVDVSSPAQLPGLVLTESHAGPAQQGPLIIDGHGDLVWSLPLSPGSDVNLRAFNVRAQEYQGQTVLSWFQGAVVMGHGRGHYELYDHTYTKIKEVHAVGGFYGDLHEFLITPQGTALFTCYGQNSADLTPYGGPKDGAYFYGLVQEVDIATGKLVFEWDGSKHVPLADSYVPAPTDAAVPWDYFHINCINVDPSDGNLVISGRNTWTIYKVDRQTGKVLWQMGGKHSDFAVPKDAHFAFQHDVTPQPDGTFTIFDNEGGPPAEASQSRALVLAVNEKARKVSLDRQYLHSPSVQSFALGSVQDLAAGHRFVGWGESSYFTEYGADGRPLLDARLTPGTVSYRAFKATWTGQPKTAPAIAVSGGSGQAVVYASWNGATDVATWAVLGGPSASSLSVLGHGSRVGFETAITVHNPPAQLAVQALSASGRVLGQSSAQARP